MRDGSTDCPSPARLREFLEHLLSEAERGEVTAHIETCATCRTHVDDWTADSTVCGSVPHSGASSPALGEPRLADPMERQHLEPSGETTDGPADDGATGHHAVPGEVVSLLDFLSSSDRPGSLGRLGTYEVLDLIGQGGMGIVLKALDIRLNRIVAIKVLMPALAGSAVARRRFSREAQAAAAVCHEHVVTIHAVDEAAGLPYLVMQLVAGQSLQERLDRDGPLGLAETLRIGMQIAAGLAAAHAQGLVHRDIKPANILLENSVARVKITDFGLARALDDASLTASGTIVGTPNYMSPEQARGEPIDHRTDLFSLGSVLYAMCTGQPPFRASTTVAVLRKVSDDPPRPIREWNPAVPRWLEAALAKLMAKEPAERYQTAAEVADLLARHLAELQEPSRPAPARISAPPARPNRKRWLGVAAVLLGASVLALGLWAWASRRPAHTARRDGAESDPSAVLASPPAPPNPPPVETRADTRVASAPDPETRAKAAHEIQAGESALKAGRPAEAIDHFSKAISLDSSNPDALLRRAGVYRQNAVENWSGSIADSTAAIERDRRNVSAYETRAYAYLRSGEFRRAVADATEMLRIDPGRIEAYSHRGSAYSGLREWDHAIADLDRFLAARPNSAWPTFIRGQSYQGRGDTAHALVDFNRAVELDRKTQHFWGARGELRVQMGDFDGGMADLAEALRLSPDSEKHLMYLARARAKTSLSLIDAAIADYDEAILRDRSRIEASYPGVFASRGALYLAHGNVDRALADLDAAIRLNPRVAYFHYHRGVARARQGRFDKAIEDFEAGIKAAEGDRHWTGASMEGRADALAMAGRYEQADAAYGDCLKFDPSRGHPVLVTRGWFFDRTRGDYDAMMKKLDEAAKGGMIIQFLHRGLVYAWAEKPDLALADFAEVLDRAKTRKDWFATADHLCRWLVLLLGRGEAYLQKGDLDRALADSNEAIQFAPQSAEARLLRARVHARRGNDDLAAADRRESLRLVPDPMLARPKPGFLPHR